jgi:peptidoglycan/LPS O-acetylase OafA/YrhL
LNISLNQIGVNTYLSQFPNVALGLTISILLGLTFTLFLSENLWNSVIPGGWSIQAEVFHYLVFPLIRKATAVTLMCIFITVNMVTLILTYLNNKGMFESVTSFLRIPIEGWIRLAAYTTIGFFLSGFVFLKILSLGSYSQAKKFFFRAPNKIKVLVLIYSFSFIFLPCPFGKTYQAVIYVIASLLLSKYIVLNLNLRTIFLFLGKYSYFIYFFHFLIQDILKFALVDSIKNQMGLFLLPIVYITSLFFSLLLAIPSMRYFEMPFMRAAK